MKKIKILAGIMIVLSFVFCSTIIYLANMRENSNDIQENIIVAEHIYDSVYNEIMAPIMVSKTMAYSTFLQEKLTEEDSVSEKEMESQMSQYLSNLRQKFNYSSAFVVSESTHRYYTANGITKILNPQTTPYDIWYPIFIESGKEYDLDTDRDQANNYVWTVFVNIKITDKNDNLLGVCGVGVIMDELQGLFQTFEDDFDVKVNLIDTEGLVQVDTISKNIENSYISEAIADKAGSEEFVYSQRGMSGFRMTKFVPELDWYLVVQGSLEQKTFGPNIIIILVLNCIFLLLVFLGICHFISKGEKKARQDPLEDSLTGLPNRNYFREAYGEMGIFTTTRYKSIVFFDVDNMGAKKGSGVAGDTIKNVILISKGIILEQGQLVRWSEDGFLALMEISAENAKNKFTEICQRVNQELNVTISAGITEIDLSDTIKKNYYRTFIACYTVKEAGGNGVRIFQ
ncbi:MAG: diguanylate cyclase [Treponema sp.]|nr:diguanylate cyclase [Treponema sp.]